MINLWKVETVAFTFEESNIYYYIISPWKLVKDPGTDVTAGLTSIKFTIRICQWLYIHQIPRYLSHSNTSTIQIIASEVQSEGRYSFSICDHFWPRDKILFFLDLFVPWSTSFIQYFWGYKSSKNDEDAVLCTRLYIEPTEALVEQERNRILLILLNVVIR